MENIREIRLSQLKFNQKVTDLYATTFDYDKDAKITRQFFKMVQKSAPDGKIVKADVSVDKNYLREKECPI